MKKIIISIVCILLAIFLVAGGIGAYLLYEHQKNAFTADDIPFGLEWGMSQKAVEDWLFYEYGYVCDERIADQLAFTGVEWEERELMFSCIFGENGLESVSVKIYNLSEQSKHSIFEKISELYKKADSVEILTERDPYCRIYIMEDKEASIYGLSEMILFSISSIESWDHESGNSVIEAYKEAEELGLKTITVP